jgi:drug/metabolite transporter (DMT)-like permease
MPSSSEASRIVENISEAPKKTTIVHSSVFRSTGGHDSRAPLMSERVNDRPVLAGALGALVIAFSAILVRLAEVSPSTAAFFRCAYAVPALGLLAWIERRRYGPRPLRERMITLGTGALFAADLVLWHYSIQAVGAGLATVLGNIQVVLVAVLAWAFLAERPSNRTLAAIPVVFVGVVLISGVVGAGAYGDDPVLGVVYGVATAIAYALFILVLRHANADLRRPAGPLFDATLSAAVFCALAGVLIGDIDWVPDLEAQGWLVLLALSSQVLGWLLISVSLPRLPAAVTSILLMLQPVSTVFLGALLLSEEPSAVQLSGVAIVLAGVAFATIQPRKRELETA